MIDRLEKAQGYAKEIVAKLNERLKDDENFDSAWYTWYGWDTIEFSASIKQVKYYKYLTVNIKFDDLEDVEKIVNDMVEDWNRRTTPEDIDSFVGFVDFGEKYGWD